METFWHFIQNASVVIVAVAAIGCLGLRFMAWADCCG